MRILGRSRRRLPYLLATAAIATLSLSLASGCRTADTGGDAFASDVDQVQMLNTQVGGKNVYLPSTVVLTAGSGRSLSVYNTVGVPHGFSIAGLGVEEVLPPNAEHVVELPELEGGSVYRIHCHLHPPHRTGTLVVLPARQGAGAPGSGPGSSRPEGDR